jgi:hypothetical protein
MATKLTTTQLDNAKRIVAIGKQRGMSDRDILTALNVAWVESKLKTYANSNVPASLAIPHDDVAADHASVGVFQQQVGMWGTASELMNLTTAANKFFDALAAVGSRATMSVGTAAQTVQKSAHPDRYDAALAESTSIYNQVKNGGEIGLDAEADPSDTPTGRAQPNPLEWLTQPLNWKRIGVFALGAFLVGFVVWNLVAETDAGKAVGKAAIKLTPVGKAVKGVKK